MSRRRRRPCYVIWEPRFGYLADYRWGGPNGPNEPTDLKWTPDRGKARTFAEHESPEVVRLRILRRYGYRTTAVDIGGLDGGRGSG